jgi:bifunctional ADP-heptose synthase (sugar kinase/adenylyltransferase)
MKVLVIGDAMVDVYDYGTVNRMSPEDPTIPVVDVDKTEKKLGGCMNVAANIKSLSAGMANVTVACLASKSTQQMLKDRDISFWGAEPLTELIKYRVYTNKQLIRVDNKKAFEEFDISRFVQELRYLNLNAFDAIVVSDYCKGTISSEVIERLKHTTCPIFIDTKSPVLSDWETFSDRAIFKLNHGEWMKAQLPSKALAMIVTCGDKGAKIMHGSHVICEVPVQHVDNPDVVGAGDVFLAGLALSYKYSTDIVQAVNFANKAANVSVRKRGTCTVDFGELK